jgi:tetratricopeptide (TPR) repeat protein
MAHYHANIGQADRARQLLQRALELEPRDMYVRYDAALTLVSLGELDDALDELERAVELGYLPVLLPVDAGLAPLHESDRFKAVLQ